MNQHPKRDAPALAGPQAGCDDPVLDPALAELLSRPSADLSAYQQTIERLQRMTGDELVSLVGPEVTYELVAGLDRHGKTIANETGVVGRLAPNDGMRKRNLWLLRMRLVDGRSAEESGALANLSGARVRQILRRYFGIQQTRPPRRRITIPPDGLQLAREAARRQFASVCGQLQETLISGDEIAPVLGEFERERALVTSLEAGGHAYIPRSSGARLVRALRAQRETEQPVSQQAPRSADERAAALQRLLDTLLS